MMTAAGWDERAKTLDEAWRAVWAEADPDAGVGHCMRMLRPLIEHINVADDPHVLDLGAGIGRLALPIAAAHRRAHMWALDVSPRMLRYLTQRTGYAGVINACPVLGDGATIPRAVPTLDGAYSVVTFQHLPADLQASYVAQIGARLRPGGVARLQFVTDTEPGPLSHPVEPEGVRRWCAAAGLDPGPVDLDPRFPTWRWITAARPRP